jgi:hypothetical protein
MRKIVMLVAALSLGACATITPQSGVRSLGGDTFMVSELSGFGSVIQRAASYCASIGQVVEVQATSENTGVASGRRYSEIVFRCVS